jgi:hypothetical protein
VTGVVFGRVRAPRAQLCVIKGPAVAPSPCDNGEPAASLLIAQHPVLVPVLVLVIVLVLRSVHGCYVAAMMHPNERLCWEMAVP